MGRPPKCACQCNYVLYSSSIAEIDDSGDRTVRFQSCDLSRMKSGHDAAWCTDIDDRGFEYHCNSNVNSFPVYAKRNKDGETIWEYIGTEGHFDEQYACVDNQYNVYGVGQEFNGGSEVLKLNSDGTEDWKNNYPDDSGFSGFGSIVRLNFRWVACDKDGNCIVTGQAVGHLGTDPGDPSSGIIAKYDSDGVLLWYVVASDFGVYGSGAIQDSNFGLPTIADNGDFYVGLEDFSTGVGATLDTPHLFKFDSSGNLLWSEEVGTFTTTPIAGPYKPVYGVVLDRDENLHVAFRKSNNSETYLAKYTGGEWDLQAWEVVVDGNPSGSGPVANVNAIACNGKIPACVYLAVDRGVEDPSDPYPGDSGERYNSDDGTLEERIEFSGFTDSVVASPGRHPSFF